MSAANIRPATMEDYPAISHLADELQAMHAEGNPLIFQSASTPLLSEAKLGELIGNPNFALLVADLDGQIVGFAYAYLDDRPPSYFERAQRLVMVEMLAIDEAHQGRGIGKSLMHEIHEWGVAKRATHAQLNVWAFNGRAQAFYEAQGYETMMISMSRALL